VTDAISHTGTMGPSSYISPQDLSEESPTIPESGNAPPGFALPNDRRSGASSDTSGQRAQPFREVKHTSEDATKIAQQAITSITEKSPPSKEDRTPSAYPLEPTPVKELDRSNDIQSNDTDRVSAQKPSKIDQDVEGHRLPEIGSTEVAFTVENLSPEISKVAALLAPKFLSTLGMDQRKSLDPEVIVINEDPADISDQPLDASKDAQAATASKLPYNSRNSRSGEIDSCISSENMNVSSGSGTPLSDRIRLQFEELLKSGLSNLLARSARSARCNGSTVGGNHGPIHAAKGKEIQCRFCKKVLPRDCDMKYSSIYSPSIFFFLFFSSFFITLYMCTSR
jgi:hypothetical protein